VLEFAVFPKIHSIKRERLGLPCHIELVLHVLLPYLRDSYLRTGGLFSCSLWLILHVKKWHCVHVRIVATSKVIQQHVGRVAWWDDEWVGNSVEGSGRSLF